MPSSEVRALEALVPPPDAPVRVAPAPVRRLGPLAALVALGSARQSCGRGPMHIFRVLGKDPALFRAWSLWSGKLLGRGRLPSRDTELVILRVAARCGSGYEWQQHVTLAGRRGLSDAEIAGAAGQDHAFTPRQQALLATVDELLADRRLSDATWTALRLHLTDERDVIELCLLVGQYQGLATALGGLWVPVER